jgi:hypothetical protein
VQLTAHPSDSSLFAFACGVSAVSADAKNSEASEIIDHSNTISLYRLDEQQQKITLLFESARLEDDSAPLSGLSFYNTPDTNLLLAAFSTGGWRVYEVQNSNSASASLQEVFRLNTPNGETLHSVAVSADDSSAVSVAGRSVLYLHVEGERLRVQQVVEVPVESGAE